ncbi:MAG TPA: oxidoreductase, partial [Thermoanaerobaculia bacterium]
VEWFLSVDREDLPGGGTTFRSMAIDGEEVDFTGGFENLHTEVYRDVLGGGGFGIEDARPSIELVHRIRGAAAKP